MMKKQILFLTFLLAVFAGMNSAFAQPTYIDDPQLDAAVASCPVPVVLNCATTAGALTPSPGVIYTYDIEVTAGSKVQWFVTTDLNVISSGTLTSSIEPASGGTYVLSAGTTGAGGNATYNDDANTGDILEVAWNNFDPGTTVLLVAFAVDADGCTNNIEAYKIEPVFNFVLEIFALEDDGTLQVSGSEKECVSEVQGATFDGANLTMDYGDNYIYYLVTSANWVHSWLPTFTAPTSAGGSTVGTVEWTYADDAATAGATWYTATDPVLASHWGVNSVDANGQCIVLRVNIDHGNVNEFLAAETYTTGVDGVMYDVAAASGSEYTNTTLADLDEGGAGNPCVNNVTDVADYVITPRPDINAEAPTPFVPKN